MVRKDDGIRMEINNEESEAMERLRRRKSDKMNGCGAQRKNKGRLMRGEDRYLKGRHEGFICISYQQSFGSHSTRHPLSLFYTDN